MVKYWEIMTAFWTSDGRVNIGRTWSPVNAALIAYLICLGFKNKFRSLCFHPLNVSSLQIPKNCLLRQLLWRVGKVSFSQVTFKRFHVNFLHVWPTNTPFLEYHDQIWDLEKPEIFLSYSIFLSSVNQLHSIIHFCWNQLNSPFVDQILRKMMNICRCVSVQFVHWWCIRESKIF